MLVVVVFNPTQSDLCVYIHGSGDTPVIFTLYVDDILINGNDPALVDKLKTELKNRFEMKDMGKVKLILGMEVSLVLMCSILARQEANAPVAFRWRRYMWDAGGILPYLLQMPRWFPFFVAACMCRVLLNLARLRISSMPHSFYRSPAWNT